MHEHQLRYLKKIVDLHSLLIYLQFFNFCKNCTIFYYELTMNKNCTIFYNTYCAPLQYQQQSILQLFSCMGSLFQPLLAFLQMDPNQPRYGTEPVYITKRQIPE